MNWESVEVSGLGQERFWSQEGQYKRHQRGRTTCKTEDGGAWAATIALSHPEVTQQSWEKVWKELLCSL